MFISDEQVLSRGYYSRGKEADFAPFTPELLGALTPGCKNAGLIGQPNNFLDNLNFNLGCPNDY
jgi:hypothetical protein